MGLETGEMGAWDVRKEDADFDFGLFESQVLVRIFKTVLNIDLGQM